MFKTVPGLHGVPGTSFFLTPKFYQYVTDVQILVQELLA